MNTEQSQPFVLRQSLLWIMAIASGLAVANLYYKSATACRYGDFLRN
ncbi:hypothetical protein QE450_000169 [Paenibacillus sp. SORGH_AS306]|nr:hypothetical protein [Paenibacillus sp. SORGH_AS_0306]